MTLFLLPKVGSPNGRINFAAMFHADVVVGLARGLRVGLHASPVKVAALFASVRLLSARFIICVAKTEQHQQNDGDGWHDDLLCYPWPGILRIGSRRWWPIPF
jgi:hypothetical protein